MATPWTITEFDLSTIIFRQRESFRHKILWTAVPIAVVFAVMAIMRNGTEWFGAVGPWIVGLVAFAFAALLIVAMIERAKERRGMQAAAEVTDVSSLADVLGSQLDAIGPLAGVNVRDVLEATSTMLSGPSSEQATPPEHRPDRRIVAGLIQIILWTIIAIVALATRRFRNLRRAVIDRCRSIIRNGYSS